jgi:hypothetical membrane protein
MRQDSIYANLALGLFGTFIVLLVALHALTPEYTPIDHMISDYAVGSHGWIMSIAFAALSLGCLALSIGLWRAGPRSILTRIGSILLAVVFVGLIVTVIFPTDLETAPVTLHGNIHTISFLVNICCILLAACVLSISFRKDTSWRAIRMVSLSLFVLVVAAFVAQVLTLHRGAPYGIMNRLFVATFMVWLLSTAWQLRVVTQRHRLG